jgi:hypothetical protein
MSESAPELPPPLPSPSDQQIGIDVGKPSWYWKFDRALPRTGWWPFTCLLIAALSWFMAKWVGDVDRNATGTIPYYRGGKLFGPFVGALNAIAIVSALLFIILAAMTVPQMTREHRRHRRLRSLIDTNELLDQIVLLRQIVDENQAAAQRYAQLRNVNEKDAGAILAELGERDRRSRYDMWISGAIFFVLGVVATVVLNAVL